MYTKTHSDQEQKQQPTVYASDDYGTGFLRYNCFLASQIDSHGGRLHSFRHFSNVVPIEVHRMWFTLLQLVLGVQKWFSPACKHATHLKCDSIHVQDLLVSLKTLLPERF
jgi:hypothetical protein